MQGKVFQKRGRFFSFGNMLGVGGFLSGGKREKTSGQLQRGLPFSFVWWWLPGGG